MHPGFSFQRMIDLGGFLKAVFRYWRQMLVLGVVCGLILMMVPVMKYKTGINKETDSAAAAEDDSYKYITQEEYETAISNLERNLAAKKQYLANSYIMAADPFHAPVTKEYIYIDLLLNAGEIQELNEIGMMIEETAETTENGDKEEGANTQQAGQGNAPAEEEGGAPIGVNTEVQYLMARVMGAYSTFLSGRIDWTDLAEKIGTEPRFIKECLSVETALDSAQIIINIRCLDKETAYAVLDYAEEQLQIEKETIKKTLCDHTLKIQARSHDIVYDSSLRNTQESFISEISTSEQRLDNFRDAKSSYVRSGTRRASLSKKTVARNALAGFLGGAIILFVIRALLIFAGGKVISGRELALSYDMRILASMKQQEKKKKPFHRIDDYIESIGTGGDGNMTEDEKFRRAAQMTELYAAGPGKVILTGDVPFADIQTAAEKMQSHLTEIELICSAELLENAKDLKRCVGVILVEKKDVSKLDLIENDIRMAGELQIPIIGAVILAS